MTQNVYLRVTGFIFLLIAILHLLRLVFGWEAVIVERAVPHWLSVVALIVAGYLAYEGFRLGRR